MIHIDRNHHSPLSNSPHSKQNLILPSQHSVQLSSSWSERAQRPPNSQSDSSKQQQESKRDPATPPEGDPVVAGQAHSTSPTSPADGNSTSPTAEERSSSLSPVPEAGLHAGKNADADTKTEDKPVSRPLTPLSDLSPPPEDMETPGADEPTEKQESSETNADGGDDSTEVNGAKPLNSSFQQHSNSGLDTNGNNEANPQQQPLMNNSTAADATHSNEQRVGMLLELNAELIKVSMGLQARGVPLSDSRFQQYSSRIQSNLDYMARWVDSKPVNPALLPLPIVEPPPLVDFTPTERIQQLYNELGQVFAKAHARRNSFLGNNSPSTPNLKRERSEDVSLEMMNKRRDTGDNKMLNSPSMMPPPSLPSQPHENQFSTPSSSSSSPMLNGMMPGSSQMLDPLNNGGMANPSDAQLAAQRLRFQQQQQQRQQMSQGMQGNRQMSPPSSSGGMNQPGGGGIPNQMNAVAGPSNQPTVLSQQAAYQVLQHPNHPLLQLVMKEIPNFTSLPVQEQVRKISQFATLQAQQQQRMRQQNAMGMGASTSGVPPSMGSVNMGMGVGGPSSGGIGMSGNPFPNQSGQVSPVSHQAPMAQNPMLMGQSGGGGLDPQRSMSGTPQMGGMSNQQMTMNTMNQRQLMLMQQQQQNRGGGGMGGGGGNMNMGNMMMSNMNPQQQMVFMQQQQERMRQQQQQQQQMSPQAGSPTHNGAGSPMLGANATGDNSFPPVLRSGSGAGGGMIPGIARSARSPTDSAQSPMTPRVPSRMPSMGQDDFSRMMMQQQQQSQGGPSRGMQPQGGFNPQQMASSNWQHQQQQQGMGLGPSTPYGMSRPESATGFAGGQFGGGMGGGGNIVGGGGSPPGGMPQTWGASNNANGSYPFPTPSPGHQSDLASTRHMSATPAPGQQPMQAQNMISPTSS